MSLPLNTDQRHVAVRGPQRRTGGRSARVVKDVLNATLGVLARDGAAAVSFAVVADLAQVSRSTLYRRWPTRSALIRAALLHVAEREHADHDTGTLRADVITFVRLHAKVRSLACARAPLSATTERVDPELMAVAQLATERMQRPVLRAVERAIARGELPMGTDPMLVVIPIVATLQHPTPTDDELACSERVVDVVLAGARAGAAVRTDDRLASAEAALRVDEPPRSRP